MLRRTMGTGWVQAVAALLLTPVVAWGQAVCGDGREAIPTIGVGTFHCQGGTCLVRGAVGRTNDGRAAVMSASESLRESVLRDRGRDPDVLFDFSVQPRLWEIDPDGPAAGRIEGGDQLLAVNGASITSAEGGRILSDMVVGEPLALQVRRGPSVVTVTVSPAFSCGGLSVSVGPNAEPSGPIGTSWGTRVWAADSVFPAPPVPVVDPVPPGEPVADAPPPPPPVGIGRSMSPPRVAEEMVAPPPPVPDMVMERRATSGTLRVGIRCSSCGRISGESGTRWSFSEYPSVTQVNRPGPAADAGIEEGDVLTHINGLDLLTPEGGERFGSLIAGERVELRYQRDGEEFTVVLTVAPRR